MIQKHNILGIPCLLAIAAIAFLATGCANNQQNTPVFDYKIYIPRHASGFTITATDSLSQSSLITVKNPWQGADGVEARLLVLRGNDSVPAGFEGQVLRGEAKRIACLSSTQIAMLDAIGAADRVVATANRDLVANPIVAAKGKAIADIGYEGNVDFERLVGANPDLVLVYGVTGASSIETKLQQLKIPYLYVGEYLEQSPLGKAEWMVPIAEVCGLRDLGIDRFSQIPVRYEAVKQMAAKAGGKRPVVMLNTPYQDAWFMPSADNYMARLIDDAGGNYIYSQTHGNKSEAIDMEQAYLMASTADYWINTGRARSLDELKTAYPKFANIPAITSGHVYNNNARLSPGGGNDFYESGIVHPDLILLDLLRIFHPTLCSDSTLSGNSPLTPDSLIYYRRLK